MDKNSVIKTIDEFCKIAGMKPSSVGQLSVANRGAYDRIKSGSAHLNTITQMLEWIAAEKVRRGLVASGDV